MENSDLKNSFQVFTIIYVAILVGQLIFAGVVFLLNDGVMESSRGIEGVFEITGIAILVGAFTASIFIFQNLINKAAKERDLDTKIDKARSAYIVRWALLEGAGLFLLVGLLLTGNTLFLMLFGIEIVMFLSARISGNRLRQQLKLSRSEMQELGFKD
jgi:hypothetical protein